MEENKTHQDNKLFHFDKNSKKASLKPDSRIQNRRNHLFKHQDADDIKRNRDEHNVALRKEAKNKKFAKRRNYGANTQSDVGTTNSTPVEKIEYTIEQAQSLWEEGMDIMDYFKILANTKFELSHFLLILEFIGSNEDPKVLFAVVGLRKLLSLIDNPPIQNVIDANLLPQLISLIGRSDIPRIQFEVLWCLTNIASGKAEHVQALIDKGTIPIFISLLGTTHRNEDGTETYHNPYQQNIVEQSIWALGNIAGEDTYYKAMILKEGALKPLANILQNAEPNSMLARNCMWCITNLLRGKPLPSFEELIYIIPIIKECLKMNDRKEIVIDGMWAISYISDAGEQAVIRMIECGILNPLMAHLQHSNNNIIMPCVRALGNFVTGEDTETQTVIDAGVLPYLHALLSHQDNAIVKETCWTLSNICAGTINQISVLIETGIIDKMIELTSTDVYEIQREAGWSISNATALRDTDIVAEIVKRKGIEAMSHVLTTKVDIKTAVVLLEGIRNCLEVGQQSFINEQGDNEFALIVEQCGGLDTIEQMQEHENQQIYEIAVEIIESYFQVEEVDLDGDADDMLLQF
ncbi:unnamed protein product [Moneuplotes crassus]|uniref:Importin subunit alpha n=1 Tax=Euplotes crassus TaxID=5936 RepID=A0AAD1XA77_EUPCR|nr:unnamed protein product [Moneuplotes crassus]